MNFVLVRLILVVFNLFDLDYFTTFNYSSGKSSKERIE